MSSARRCSAYCSQYDADHERCSYVISIHVPCISLMTINVVIMRSSLHHVHDARAAHDSDVSMRVQQKPSHRYGGGEVMTNCGEITVQNDPEFFSVGHVMHSFST